MIKQIIMQKLCELTSAYAKKLCANVFILTQGSAIRAISIKRGNIRFCHIYLGCLDTSIFVNDTEFDITNIGSYQAILDEVKARLGSYK